MLPYKIKFKFVHNKDKMKFTNVLNASYKMKLKFAMRHLCRASAT